MHAILVILGIGLIVAILVEGFETIVQPRRVTRRYRVSLVYYTVFWPAWRWAATTWFAHGKRRAAFLSAFGPLSLLGIFATWVVGLVLGFALLHWGLADAVQVTAGDRAVGFTTYLYFSGTTFFTAGYGDITPVAALSRFLAVVESGLGFGFLAAILSYLPALFQAYSRREVNIALLDARAGSPPSAAQLILRAARGGVDVQALAVFMGGWERWSAELLESQLSFPVLAYYRSQHDNQSWLAALATVLDACALLMSQVRGVNTYQAELTFAVARHAAVDLALVLRADAPAEIPQRLSPAHFASLRKSLAAAGVSLVEDADAAQETLRTLRGMYEPFLLGLSERLLLAVPPVVTPDGGPDNWQRSAWMMPAPGIGALPTATPNESHFG